MCPHVSICWLVCQQVYKKTTELPQSLYGGWRVDKFNRLTFGADLDEGMIMEFRRRR